MLEVKWKPSTKNYLKNNTTIVTQLYTYSHTHIYTQTHTYKLYCKSLTKWAVKLIPLRKEEQTHWINNNNNNNKLSKSKQPREN